MPRLRLGVDRLQQESIAGAEVIEVYVKVFERNGFHGPVSWYRNLDRNRERVPEFGTRPLDLPCLMITAAWDAALPPSAADGMPALCSDMERYEVAACGHWTPREKPEELTRVLLDWLDRRIRSLV